jgi:carbon-monoxide dehydrogenase medium subunit
MLRRFRMEEPESVTEVAELLARFGESAKLYAGGTELLLAMKEGLVQYEHLINVKSVKGLNEVSVQNGMIKIGALCTHHQLERSAILWNQLPTLVKLEQNARTFVCVTREPLAAIFVSLSLMPIQARCC